MSPLHRSCRESLHQRKRPRDPARGEATGGGEAERHGAKGDERRPLTAPSQRLPRRLITLVHCPQFSLEPPVGSLLPVSQNDLPDLIAQD